MIEILCFNPFEEAPPPPTTGAGGGFDLPVFGGAFLRWCLSTSLVGIIVSSREDFEDFLDFAEELRAFFELVDR